MEIISRSESWVDMPAPTRDGDRVKLLEIKNRSGDLCLCFVHDSVKMVSKPGSDQASALEWLLNPFSSGNVCVTAVRALMLGVNGTGKDVRVKTLFKVGVSVSVDALE